MPHLIPYAGRNLSGSVTQNLLWQCGNIYLMDNHRAALWCWYQAIDLYNEKHRIFHIDRHTDALSANLEDHIKAIPNLFGLSIGDYLDAKVDLWAGPAYLFRWDNYLSIHLARYSKTLCHLTSVDHGDGDCPRFESVQRPTPDSVLENIGFWLSCGDIPWILNIDLDYFFGKSDECDESGDRIWIPLFSAEFIDSVFRQIRDAIETGKVKVVTVCLTPSYFTPGWQACTELSQRIFKILNVCHPNI